MRDLDYQDRQEEVEDSGKETEGYEIHEDNREYTTHAEANSGGFCRGANEGG